MGFFKKLFRIPSEEIRFQLERRKNPRYTLDDMFPLGLMIEANGRKSICQILDVSSHGLRIKSPHEFKLQRGEKIKCSFRSLEYSFSLGAKACHIGEDTVGLDLILGDFAAMETYLQTILPVFAGRSLEKFSPHQEVVPGKKNWLKQVYLGECGVTLTIYSEANALPELTEFGEFEFSVSGYLIHGSSTNHIVSLYRMTEGEEKTLLHRSSGISVLQNTSEASDVALFFNLFVMSLKDKSHKDIKQYLKGFTKEAVVLGQTS